MKRLRYIFYLFQSAICIYGAGYVHDQISTSIFLLLLGIMLIWLSEEYRKEQDNPE